MTNKEIIDASDAEIARDQAEASQIKLGNPIASATILSHIAYVNGLRFAKELIEKRIEVTE